MVETWALRSPPLCTFRATPATPGWTADAIGMPVTSGHGLTLSGPVVTVKPLCDLASHVPTDPGGTPAGLACARENPIVPRMVGFGPEVLHIRRRPYGS